MIPEIGYGAVIVAMVLAAYGSVACAVGARTRVALVESGQHAALGVFIVTACFLLLVYAFLTFDFSVRYVANNADRVIRDRHGGVHFPIATDCLQHVMCLEAAVR